ncbi:MAG: hypothetical protein IJ574_04395 [Bacilli bacterium]|nr:hypothetical protein [Bacilli bacterium]
MLDKLEVLNGELMPEFDSYNMNYSVIIDDEVNSLQLNMYSSLVNADIIVEGNNNLTYGENLVTIKVVKDDNESIYTLHVYKEDKESTVAFVDDNAKALEIKAPEKLPDYVAPLIGITCFLIILTLFLLLFKPRKIKN